jgi:hypothetical protein
MLARAREDNKIPHRNSEVFYAVRMKHRATKTNPHAPGLTIHEPVCSDLMPGLSHG